MPYTLTISGKVYSLQPQKVMGILNLTPDSFFADSRCTGTAGTAIADEALRRVERMLADGLDILDLGAVSTRPGSQAPSAEEEWRRLEAPLRLIARHFPDLPVSIDTYRADIARRCVENSRDGGTGICQPQCGAGAGGSTGGNLQSSAGV